MSEPSKKAFTAAMEYFTGDKSGKTYDFYGDNQRTLAVLLDKFAKEAIEEEFRIICECALGFRR